MTKPLPCLVGRHTWQTEMQRLDDVEAARPVRVCSRCRKTHPGERIPERHGAGTHEPTGGAEGGGWTAGF